MWPALRPLSPPAHPWTPLLPSTPPSFLPPKVRVLMERVRNGADFMPTWQLHQTLEAELGTEWRKHVEQFDETPVAAASIGQV